MSAHTRAVAPSHRVSTWRRATQAPRYIGVDAVPHLHLQAYQCLAALEGTATLAQNTMDGISALDQQELRKLSLYFDRASAFDSS